MFIVKFQGDLGNQMFEYAFVKRLEKTYRDTEILAHVSPLRYHNGYKLEKIFNAKIRQCSNKGAIMYADEYREEKILHFFLRFRMALVGQRESYLKQDDYTAFYPELFSLNPLRPYYFDGVWANSEYLRGIEDVLNKDFAFPQDTTAKNLEYANQMKDGQSVSIHVRRRDFLLSGGTLGDDYYFRAIQFMKSKLDKPKFFVFSDDHEYCKKLFSNTVDLTYVTGNIGENSFRDMQLMNCCKHHIIANSTFSFWGAFLGGNPQKIVLNPASSFVNCRHSFSYKGWITI